MAGFDLDTQHSYVLPGGGRGESGRVDFSAGSFCQALPTRLLTMYAWNASPAIDYTAPGSSIDAASLDNRVTVDINDVTAGYIIVKRATTRTDMSSSWWYSCAGW